ncbi:hypothetical protein DPMN_066697 [Dreissena polymorpha]|uniref:Uncharacterized protein n=1 Tax=Dreissena polymorpha TaxID=45954 RepID=A0A9D4BKR4_DREPO|nr:hypothetical protein DPMN_066697 [Dreissena polymorpha]
MWRIKSIPKDDIVLTRFCYSHTSGHVFRRTVTIFEFSRGIITTNVRTKFHGDLSINVTSRVLKKFFYSHTNVLTKFLEDLLTIFFFILTKLPSFEHEKNIIWTILLTKFHDNRAINVAYRVLTRKNVDDALRTNGDPKSTP